MKPIAASLNIFFALLFFCTTGICQPARVVLLSSSPKTPTLQLALNLPEGWSTEWYQDSKPSIVRLYNSASGGREALVVAVSSLPTQFVGKTADETYNEGFFHGISRMLHSTVQKRMRCDFWDGAYFEYLLPLSTDKGRVTVKNWMMISGSLLVQFQCYYYVDLALSEADQNKKILQLDSTYIELLKSVRRND